VSCIPEAISLTLALYNPFRVSLWHWLFLVNADCGTGGCTAQLIVLGVSLELRVMG
jgi:hypothetical protein